MAERAPIESTDQVMPEGLPLGAGKKDLEHILRVNAESFKKLYPKIRYKKLDRVQTATTVHALYKESKRKVFADDTATTVKSVLVPAFIVWQPQEKMLQRYGLEAHQGAIAVFCNRVNDELGIDPVTGDLVEYLGEEFEIMTVKLEDFLLNSQVALNKYAALKNLAKK